MIDPMQIGRTDPVAVSLREWGKSTALPGGTGTAVANREEGAEARQDMPTKPTPKPTPPETPPPPADAPPANPLARPPKR